MFREIFSSKDESSEEKENPLIGKEVTLSPTMAGILGVRDNRQFHIAEVRENGQVRLEEIGGWFNPDVVNFVEK